MPKLLDRQVDKLKGGLAALGDEVQQAVDLAVHALLKRDADTARAVIAGDARIDQAEVDMEEDCLKVLALYQPVAIDLRFIISILKINNDLERIGDLAVSLAERAVYLADHPEVQVPAEFESMSVTARQMLRMALHAFLNGDGREAYRVCALDEEVDDAHRRIYPLLEKAIMEHPENTEALLRVTSISRFVERIADHATNIAEDVLYLLEGNIVRHRLGKVIVNPEETS